MATKTTVKSTKKPSATTKNKVIAFRFALTPEIEVVINSLENCFIGLDRSEIVKLALNQLYRSNQLDKSESNIIAQIATTKSKNFTSEDEFFEFWNNNKADLR
ncbi:MAG: hypothetical protein WCK98_05075 [bacterium]